MANSITVIGNLCADPELKESKNGKLYAKVRIADDAYGRDAIFWSCTAWGDAVKIFEKAKKGSSMVLIGELDPWKDDDDKWRQPSVKILRGNFIGGGKKKDVGGRLPF